jgi:hypothetical protein
MKLRKDFELLSHYTKIITSNKDNKYDELYCDFYNFLKKTKSKKETKEIINNFKNSKDYSFSCSDNNDLDSVKKLYVFASGKFFVNLAININNFKEKTFHIELRFFYLKKYTKFFKKVFLNKNQIFHILYEKFSNIPEKTTMEEFLNENEFIKNFYEKMT